VLGGSLLGPLAASLTSLRTALFLFTALRVLAALAVWRWGKPVKSEK
jgi:membrane protein implicated in regulation of membrane protease activity